MHFIKKNIIIPLVVFIIGMSAVAVVVCGINNEQNEQNRIMANLNAMTYAERMKTDIMEGIGVADTLRHIIISDDGQFNKFYEIAAEIMTDSVQSIHGRIPTPSGNTTIHSVHISQSVCVNFFSSSS